MKVTAWNFGIRVGIQNRNQFFDRRWTSIEVEIDGQVYPFGITPGFWNKCPEFRDRGHPIIREWLRRLGLLNWPKGRPPHVQLVPLGGARFRLVA